MDVSGNNRYELLDMDDEAGPAVVPLGGAKKKPEESNTTKKNTNKTEKENKSNTLNKNNAPSKGPNAAQTNKAKAGVTAAAAAAPGRPKNNAKGDQTTGAPHKEHQQRAVRNNQRANAEAGNSGAGGNDYGNEPPHRQFKEREYRGPPRIRNGEKFGKREFDRQSGSDKTGIKAIDKRDGAGAHNWGSAKQDIDDINKAGAGEAPQLTDKEDSANEQTGDQPNNLEEDESKQMTLDEWKALRDQRAKPNYNLRKAGEGVDNSEWKKMVVLSKKRDNNSEDDLEYDPSMYPQRVGRLQRIVDIQFNFNDNRRGGFRKGGPRGPPRSGGFRQENAGGAPAASNGFERERAPANKFGGEKRRTGAKPLKVDDELQFPTLS